MSTFLVIGWVWVILDDADLEIPFFITELTTRTVEE